MVDVRVNTYTQGSQVNASIVTLADGGYVIVWQSQGEDDVTLNFGIYAQRYDASGNPVGSEFRVNTNVAGDQTLPSVAAIGGAGFVVTWTTPGAVQGDTDIHMQRYDFFGNKAGGEVLVGTTTTNAQDQSSVVGLSNGGYVVAWTSNGDIHTQRYNSNGVAQGSETLVNTYTTDDQSNPAVAAMTGGGYIVTWQSYNQDGSDYGIYSKRYDLSGNAVGGETHVSTTTNNIQANPAVTTLTGGDYIVSWQSFGQDGSQDGIYFQRYDALGSAIGGEVQVNTTTSSVQSTPSIAALSGGGFIVTWQSFGQDGNAYGIFARSFDANGNPATAETQVNVTTVEQQTSPVVAALANGGYAIAWQSYSQDGSEYGIFKSHTAGALPNTYTGTPGDDTFTAPNANDWTISGLGGTDTLSGAGGNDFIDGGDGNDTLHGGGGHDTIHGGIGDDVIFDVPASGLNTIDGGDGNDTLDFSENGTAFGITLSLFNTAQQTVGGGTYALTGIENLTGAALNDTLYGDAQANILKGGDGNDILTGMGGNDTLIGGEGNDTFYGGPGDDTLNGGNGTDTATYQDVIAGVTVSLAIGGPQNTIAAGMDTLIGIENLRGSEFDDQLLGDANANTINGGGGADYIYGAGGTDTLNGGEGDDRIYVDSGTNTLNGSNGNDLLSASGGTNALNGGDGDDLIQSIGTSVNTIDGGAGSDTLYVDGRGRASGMIVDFTSLWTSGSGTVNGSNYTGIEALTAVVGTDFNDNINLGGAATSADVQIGDVLDLAGAGAGNDTVTGTNGFNYMSGQDGNDTMYGLGGADHLSGGNGDDVLDGGTGTDILDGGADNDILKGGAGADSMNGGTGNDTYYVDDGGDAVNEAAGEGTDTVFTYVSGYTLGANVENLTATGNGDNGDMTLTGNALNNVITGQGYQPILGYFPGDTLNGKAGDDMLYGLSGDDVLNGGDGNDMLYGGNAETWGGATSTEHDTLNGGVGNDLLDGGVGNDTMSGGTGDDTFIVDSFGDVVTENAGEGTDTVRTSLGTAVDATTLYYLPTNVENLVMTGNGQAVAGNASDNTITGTGGNDLIVLGDVVAPYTSAAQGNDTVNAGGGNDFLFFNTSFTAADTVDGGSGYDTVGLLGNYTLTLGTSTLTGVEQLSMYSSSNAASPNNYAVTTVDANVAAGQLLLVTGASLMTNEHLTFNGSAETNGNFQVFGGHGADTITTGAGADRIIGGEGADILTGGAGNDTFQYNSQAESTTAARDQIADFRTGDKIDLWFVDANTNAGGQQHFSFIGNSAFSHAAGELHAVLQTPGNWLVEGDTNGDGVADLSILVTVADGHTFGIGDFAPGVTNAPPHAATLSATDTLDLDGLAASPAPGGFDDSTTDWHFGLPAGHDVFLPSVHAGLMPVL